MSRARISDYLQGLGATSREVADNIAAQGLRGVPKCSNRCAIIVALEHNCHLPWGPPRAPRPGVLTYNDMQICDPQVPQPVAEFMTDFDDGKYPELETPSWS